MAVDNDRESGIFFDIIVAGTILDIWLLRILFVFIDLIDVSTRWVGKVFCFGNLMLCHVTLVFRRRNFQQQKSHTQKHIKKCIAVPTLHF